MRRRFITGRADWTLSSGEDLVQQERLEHLANASTAHHLQRTRHCVWFELSVRGPTEACARGPDPPRARQTERSFKAAINGLSMATPLCLRIAVWLNKAERWGNVSRRAKCQITDHKKRTDSTHTRLSVWGNAHGLVRQGHGQKGVPVSKNKPQLICWQASNPKTKNSLPGLAHTPVNQST